MEAQVLWHGIGAREVVRERPRLLHAPRVRLALVPEVPGDERGPEGHEGPQGHQVTLGGGWQTSRRPYPADPIAQ